tara:strand:+ start:1420 stop:1590 length:171 start_codon:yes stop_codon:yes gene_type:complete
MYGTQVERLRKDSRELGYFMRRLEKRGNSKKVFDLQKKREYLNARIEEMEDFFLEM